MKFIQDEITAFKSFYSSIYYSSSGQDKEEEDEEKAKKAKKEKEVQSLQIKMRLYTILDLLKSTIINAFWTI